MSRVKIRRKDLRRPDEFVELTGRVWRWLVVHRGKAAAIVAGTVVLVVAVAGIRQYNDYRDRTAAEAFRKASALFTAGDYPLAADAFAALKRGGAYGALANLYRGHAALRTADFVTAAEAFREAARRSELPPYLRQEAFYNLAFALARQGDTTAALSYYEKAAELPGPFRSDARLRAADLSADSGSLEKARELYESALDDAEQAGPAQDDLRRIARWRLAALAERPTKTQNPD